MVYIRGLERSSSNEKTSSKAYLLYLREIRPREVNYLPSITCLLVSLCSSLYRTWFPMKIFINRKMNVP